MELRCLASFANSEAMAAGRKEKGHVRLCSPGGGGDKKNQARSLLADMGGEAGMGLPVSELRSLGL